MRVSYYRLQLLWLCRHVSFFNEGKKNLGQYCPLNWAVHPSNFHFYHEFFCQFLSVSLCKYVIMSLHIKKCYYVTLFNIDIRSCLVQHCTVVTYQKERHCTVVRLNYVTVVPQNWKFVTSDLIRNLVLVNQFIHCLELCG